MFVCGDANVWLYHAVLKALVLVIKYVRNHILYQGVLVRQISDMIP